MWFQRILHRIELLHAANVFLQKESQKPDKIVLSPQALRQLNRLQIGASRYLPGLGVGLRPSLRRKPTYEFREHRMYVPGDDIRHVDWKASARQEHIFIKLGEYPREVTVNLLIDCSASMMWGDPPKKSLLLNFAAAMGYLALTHGDRLIIHPMTSEGDGTLGPISGKGQVPALLNFLRALTFKESIDIKERVRTFAKNARGGLTLIFSDLLDVDDLSIILDLLPVPRWEVIVFHILHPHELDPVIVGNFQLIDVESGKAANYDIDLKAIQGYHRHIDAWKNHLELSCVQRNAFYCLVPTNWSLEREIIPYLLSVRVLSPL